MLSHTGYRCLVLWGKELGKEYIAGAFFPSYKSSLPNPQQDGQDFPFLFYGWPFPVFQCDFCDCECQAAFPAFPNRENVSPVHTCPHTGRSSSDRSWPKSGVCLSLTWRPSALNSGGPLLLIHKEVTPQVFTGSLEHCGRMGDRSGL